MTPRAITSGRVKCPGFGSNTNGFHITFANGWTASVQFGAGNYCGNRDWSPNADPAGGFGRKAPKCHDAEVAAWFGDEDIADANLIGWQSPAQVLAFLNDVAGRPDRPIPAGTGIAEFCDLIEAAGGSVYLPATTPGAPHDR